MRSLRKPLLETLSDRKLCNITQKARSLDIDILYQENYSLNFKDMRLEIFVD